MCAAMASFASAPVLGASRSGKKLIIPRGSSLPAQCIKCGSAAQAPWRKTFYWHAPWLYILIFFPGLLIYAIVALIVRKKMELNVPLCDQHHSDRKRYSLIGALMLIGFAPVGLVLGGAFNVDAGWASLVALGMFLVGVVFYSKAQFLRPSKIDEAGGEFIGANDSFLNALSSQ
jgi:hypothetical protein